MIVTIIHHILNFKMSLIIVFSGQLCELVRDWFRCLELTGWPEQVDWFMSCLVGLDCTDLVEWWFILTGRFKRFVVWVGGSVGWVVGCSLGRLVGWKDESSLVDKSRRQ